MSNDQWNEDKIKKSLRNMPEISDHRSKEEILQRLKNDTRLSEELQPKRKQKKPKWPPILAAVAAVFLLSILIPTFLNQSSQVSMDKAVTERDKMDDSQLDNSAESAQSLPAETFQIPEEESAAFSRKFTGAPPHYAVYLSDVKDYTAFHIGLATNQATIVPITFLIPNEQIGADLGIEPDAVALYNRYAGEIDEDSLGFTSYHPYKADISSNGNQVLMKLFDKHSYDMGSAALEMLKLSVQDTFYGFDEVQFLKEDGSPITFDQAGEASEPAKISGNKSRQAYYRFTQDNGEELLSSDFGKTFDSAEQALAAMKENPNDVYSSVIPEGIDFTVTENKELLQVKFTGPLNIEHLEMEDAMQMIEGILLTAASFNLQVEFEQVVQEQWSDFDFTKPLPKPIGANPKFLILE
ncbi:MULTISPECIES: GerMN domain-containing protein [Sporosarcina]|uniref:GerMN domain-containing protein n=1 Tax=Sporosarcina TaxID=1569 RepID=UPI00129A87C9|nr:MULTISPECIES: GerMN domain-containing protein [Sporosarcina]GKV65653.1 hypothetical protein NCCP2331_18060 [Sporosarcina sp. NCCP-2331]GLB55767.1 hypothetical protein NCCP2378_15540 [Sporosarcina sp. NCCP-2378]